MINNPFASVFRQAFIDDVLKTAIYTPRLMVNHPPRVKNFMNELNKFLRTAGEAPILYQTYSIDERKILDYALFLRGYMRDAQNVLANLKQEHACDKDMIKLFEASAHYAVACNKVIGDKRSFSNDADYRFWKVDLKNGLKYATYEHMNGFANANKRNLFLFMPFRLKDNETQLQKWLYHNMNKTLDNKEVFNENIDTYVIHFPIQKSRSSNIASLLKTIRHPKEYFDKEDMDFVKSHWLHFVGQDIKLDKNNKVISGKALSDEQLVQNFKNITIFSYCAGSANAHRCLTALQSITSQIYDEKTTQKAMQQILLISYGFLPIEQKLSYSGVHFYTNAKSDDGRREPFVNLNNHTLYEKTKCTNDTQFPAKISMMPDKRNYVIALAFNEAIYAVKNGSFEILKDGEFGHSMANVNTINTADRNNFANNLFVSVLENGSLGKRAGGGILQLTNPRTIDNIIINSALKGKMQRL